MSIRGHRQRVHRSGSPWQNAWIESFNGRFRDELLNGWQFDSLREARVIIEDWRIDSNWKRPHTAHGDLTPSEFAARWATNPPQAAEHLDHSSGPSHARLFVVAASTESVSTRARDAFAREQFRARESFTITGSGTSPP